MKFKKNIANWANKPIRKKYESLIANIWGSMIILFNSIKVKNRVTYFLFSPDSQFYFKAYPEFDELFNKFIKGNRMNNCGDISRLWFYILNIKQVLSDGIEGDFAELGVWKGNTASILAYYASLHNKKVFLFDTYSGFDLKDLSGIDSNKSIDFNNTSIDLVKQVIGQQVNVCKFIKGRFPESLIGPIISKKYSLVSLDCDLYEPMKAGLEFFYPLMPKGGVILLHDYSSKFWDGSKKAIDEFCKSNNEYLVLLPDKSGSACLRKSQ